MKIQHLEKFLILQIIILVHQRSNNICCKIIKIKNLTFIDINSPKINKITKDFYRDNKRVSNKKIKKILGWTPKFENYKLGLKEILDNINGKDSANNSSLDQINGGVERGTLDIAKELIKAGFQSSLLSSGGEMAEKYKYRGVEHYELNVKKKEY